MPHLSKRGRLMLETSLVFWHDVTNNSLTRHKSNNLSGSEFDQFPPILLRYMDQNAPILSCLWFEAPRLFELLSAAGTVVFKMTNILTSRQIHRENSLSEQNSQLQLEGSLELK